MNMDSVGRECHTYTILWRYI